jgi:hypothetical protein
VWLRLRASGAGDAGMANVEGKAYALNVITPLVAWKTFCLGIFFLLIRLAIRLVGIFGGGGLLGKIPLIQVQLKLKQLSFIYFARWVVVDKGSFPRLDSAQPEEDLHYDYMIFCSNFTGTWDAYIDAFSEIIPKGIDGIWQWTINYKYTRPLTPFKQHIAANQADTDYYYSAYPGASTTDVRQALDLDVKLWAFADSALNLPPDRFDVAYTQFLESIQLDLATTGHDALVSGAGGGAPGDLAGCEPVGEGAHA